MHVGRHPGLARVFVILLVFVGAVSLAARHQPAAPPKGSKTERPATTVREPQSPRLPPEQQAYNAATRLTDPAAQLAALANVGAAYPHTDVAGEAGSLMLTLLLANFPDRTIDINRAIDQAVAGIPRTATADVRLSTIQNLANRLTEKHVALDTIEPLLFQAYGSFNPASFAAEQQALVTAGTLHATPGDITAHARRIRSGALETLGALYLAKGDSARAGKAYADAIAVNPSTSRAPLALAEIAQTRGDDATALDYYMLAEVGGHLKAAGIGTMRALYTKVHGSDAGNAGLDAALDALYLEKFPNPIVTLPARVNRMVVAELFTGTGCAPCVAADLAWDKLADHYGPDTLAMLEFHVNIPQPDPMVVGAGDARRLFYDMPGVPTMIVDGVHKTGGGVRDSAPKTYTDYLEMIDKALITPAEALVNVKASSDGRTVTVAASASRITTTSKDVRLHVVLAERKVRYTGENGVRFHTYVVRGVAAARNEIGTGFPITNVGGTTNVAYTFDLASIRDDLAKTLATEMAGRRQSEPAAGPHWDYRAEHHTLVDLNPSALVVVAYLQDASKHVLQAARFDLGGK